MSSLSTLPKGDSAWLLRKSIQRIIQQVSVLETNIGSSTTGNSANTQVIFNDNGVLRGDAGLTYNAATDLLSVGSATITGDLTVRTNGLVVNSTGASISNTTPLSGVDSGLLVGTVGASKAVAISMFNCLARLRERDAVNNFAITTNINATGTLDDNTRSSWKIRIGSGNDNYALQRAAIGSSTFQDLMLIDGGGVCVWGDGAGGTRMTLNATGLGVGGSPAAKLSVVGGNIRLDNNQGLEWGGANNYIYGSEATDFIALVTNGVEALRINNSQNLGIGVTSSAWWGGFKSIEVGSYGALSSYASGSGTSQPLVALASNSYLNSSLAYIYKTNNAAAQYQQDTGVHKWFTAASGTAGTTITDFATAKMTLDASGNLLVGTTAAAGGRLDVQTATGDCSARVKSNAAGSNATIAIDYVNSYGTHIIRKSGTDVWLAGVIADTGATPNYKIQNASAVGVQLVSGATAWTTLSDETMKDIIEPISNAVAKVGSLRSVIGKFKTDDSSKRRSFLIAQDVQSVLPEAVDVIGENNELGLRYTEVIPLLVAAIKELTARVQTLEAK